VASQQNSATASIAGSSHDRILHAAKRLFASRGYENTSTVAIARQAGTSESQLMKHFGSKEGLLEAVFDEGWGRLSLFVVANDTEHTPQQRLRKLLDLMLSGMDHDPELKQLMLLEGRRIRKEGQMVMLTRGFTEFIRVLDGVLAQMREAGQLRRELNPEAVRSALIGMFEGLLRDQLLAEKAGFPSGYGSKEMRQIFDVFAQALAGK